MLKLPSGFSRLETYCYRTGTSQDLVCLRLVCAGLCCVCGFFLNFKYLFLDRGERREEREGERNINVWLPLSCSSPGV